MATEQEAAVGRETSSVSTRFTRNRDLYLFLPSLLGFLDGNDNVVSWRERIILVNPFTQGMIVLEESSGLNPLLRDLLESREEGHPPASKASIDAMRVVDTDGWGGVCVICLEGWKEEDTVKEMPCKHRFHGGCIEKWLGFHGSCPVCRHEMPVEGDEVEKKRNDGREIWVMFSSDGGRRVRDSSGHDGNGNTAGSGGT
ncbi:RING/U-box superfamily protein [Raphanus sativus]|uniref:RING-type E3 ubiquitin transferase n=1 Tax=Raphanus sativus TaxID=3726 RepID=A0A9W3CR61_RAPSA|nr:E3 ubiquitin-protein ligase MPSR1-like [Raphanus sativus]KAJ4870775.1 RING/U-box superfamily protein [Raphanus sativus]